MGLFGWIFGPILESEREQQYKEYKEKGWFTTSAFAHDATWVEQRRAEFEMRELLEEKESD